MDNLKLWELVLTLLKFNRAFFVFHLILNSANCRCRGLLLHFITHSDKHTLGRTALDEGQHTILKRDRLSCHWRDSNLQSQQASGRRPTP